MVLKAVMKDDTVGNAHGPLRVEQLSMLKFVLSSFKRPDTAGRGMPYFLILTYVCTTI